MTPHAHPRFVPGCYRCEIGRDELLNDQTPLPRCSTCGGDGVVPVWRSRALATCSACGGTGESNGRSES